MDTAATAAGVAAQPISPCNAMIGVARSDTDALLCLAVAVGTPGAARRMMELTPGVGHALPVP